jgi:outer membrane receptor for ferrienterochelin and colicin
MSKLRTNFKNAPNIEAGYNLSIKDNNQGGRTTKFYTHSPFINFDALILKNFTFIADYSYNNFKNNETTINSYSFMDTSLTYQKKDSKWEYKLGITNLFDAKSLSQSNTSSISVSSNEYFIQPRYTVFSMKYNL